MQERRFWPAGSDRQVLQTRFWVASRPLLHDPEDLEPSRVISVIVTETPEEMDVRLREQFPLYRVVQYGKKMLGLTPVESTHEV